MLRDSNFAGGSFTVTPKPPDDKSSPKLPDKQPIYTKLGFTVTGRATLERLVDDHEAVLHQRPAAPDQEHLGATAGDQAGQQDRASWT